MTDKGDFLKDYPSYYKGNIIESMAPKKKVGESIVSIPKNQNNTKTTLDSKSNNTDSKYTKDSNPSIETNRNRLSKTLTNKENMDKFDKNGYPSRHIKSPEEKFEKKASTEYNGKNIFRNRSMSLKENIDPEMSKHSEVNIKPIRYDIFKRRELWRSRNVSQKIGHTPQSFKNNSFKVDSLNQFSNPNKKMNISSNSIEKTISEISNSYSCDSIREKVFKREFMSSDSLSEESLSSHKKMKDHEFIDDELNEFFKLNFEEITLQDLIESHTNLIQYCKDLREESNLLMKKLSKSESDIDTLKQQIKYMHISSEANMKLIQKNRKAIKRINLLMKAEVINRVKKSVLPRISTLWNKMVNYIEDVKETKEMELSLNNNNSNRNGKNENIIIQDETKMIKKNDSKYKYQI